MAVTSRDILHVKKFFAMRPDKTNPIAWLPHHHIKIGFYDIPNRIKQTERCSPRKDHFWSAKNSMNSCFERVYAEACASNILQRYEKRPKMTILWTIYFFSCFCNYGKKSIYNGIFRKFKLNYARLALEYNGVLYGSIGRNVNQVFNIAADKTMVNRRWKFFHISLFGPASK